MMSSMRSTRSKNISSREKARLLCREKARYPRENTLEAPLKRVVHVVGTGTIGEPLIGLLADHREAFGIDEVTFHKRQALKYERAKVNALCRRGAKLAVSPETRKDFEALGHKPSYALDDALDRAAVIID